MSVRRRFAILAVLLLAATAVSHVRAQRADVTARLSVADILGVPAVGTERVAAHGFEPRAGGLPSGLNPAAPFSATLMTALGGHNRFDDAILIGDLDGREDLVADLSAKVDDFSAGLAAGNLVTRVAISEHTIANGFNENVFYYADAIGNVYVNASATLGQDANLVINLPASLNAFGSLSSDSRIVVTGLAVSPVADLTSFANVNGAFSAFNGQIGEILYVSYWDTGSGLRLVQGGDIARSGLLAFPVADITSPATNPPGVISPTGFPVTMGGSFGVVFSRYSNVGGIAVDDDGSVYFHQADLIQFTGGNIVKVESVDSATTQDRSLATSGIITLPTINTAGDVYGTTSGPSTQVNRVTNYSGTSTAFGNIVALAASGNSVYAAVARSANAADDAATRATTGLFTNPNALGVTPSMIISFNDSSGSFDGCFGASGSPGPFPRGDGVADVITAGEVLTPGVNNFRVFVMGDGPDRRGGNPVFGSTANTLKLAMQIDYGIYAGLAVDEANIVYVISGGVPAGVGLNPSPGFGEILAFPDQAPTDRRADYVDLRGNNMPVPGGTPTDGDGDSDRFDHLFFSAPIDQTSFTPSGVSGLARGFLLYLNRTRNGSNPGFAGLPNGATQGDDSTHGPFAFRAFDTSEQVAGGALSAFFPVGDDSGAGGFEFSFRGVVGGTPTTVWNEFFLNSNGSVTFNAGDTDNIPTAAKLVNGPPRVAGLWVDLNPPRTQASFSLQALGYAGPNEFKVRWINTPPFGFEACAARTTFSISLFDDGSGADENNTPSGTEGPTALRFPAGQGAVPAGRRRLEGSGPLHYEYIRAEIPGRNDFPALVGFAEGGGSGGVPPETDLSDAVGTIGAPATPVVFELFNAGTNTAPEFDLRDPGNDLALTKPAGQPDNNRATVDLRTFFASTVLSKSGDFTGDGVADLAVFRPDTGQWFIQGLAPVAFGLKTDFAAPGDFNGDGTIDIAVWRPSTGQWLVQGMPATVWGSAGDIPVPADYNGDGTTDLAVYRPTTRQYLVFNQTVTQSTPGHFSAVPVPGDYDGDGDAEAATYNRVNGQWLIPTTSLGATWGAPGDVPVPADYDGDGRMDIAVWRPSNGAWYIRNVVTAVWGQAGDVPVPMDRDGDGRAELVVFRPSTGTWFSYNLATQTGSSQVFGALGDRPALRVHMGSVASDVEGDRRSDPALFRPSNGTWYTALSSTGYGAGPSGVFGANGDQQVAADFDGDRRLDRAVYRPATNGWFVSFSNANFTTGFSVVFGSAADIPQVADYDGDGRADIAMFRPATGQWFVLTSVSNWTVTETSVWGQNGDIPSVGDYDGDNRADRAVFRPSTGGWFVRRSSDGGLLARTFGQNGDQPAPVDYDGDGRTDISVYRPANTTWYVLRSSSDFMTFVATNFGLATDIRTPGDFDGDGRFDLAVFRPSTGTWFFMTTPATPPLAFGANGDQPVLRKP